MDPYDIENDTEIEAILDNRKLTFDENLIRDVLNTSKPESLKINLEALKKLINRSKKPTGKGSGSKSLIQLHLDTKLPFRSGYDRANSIRNALKLSSRSPVRDFDSVLNKASGGFSVAWVSPYSNDIEGIVSSNVNETLIGTQRKNEFSQRFLLARALHHRLYLTSAESPQRLLTRAFDWNQAASRAFAAELLAPRDALVSRVGEFPDQSQIDELSAEFQVEPNVISYQIQNRR